MYRCVASSSDGTKVIAGVDGGRLYISNDSGATWTETQPAGNVDKSWVAVASSSDGTKTIAASGGEGLGRLYITAGVQQVQIISGSITYTGQHTTGQFLVDAFDGGSCGAGNS